MMVDTVSCSRPSERGEMPWNHTDREKERGRFVRLAEEGKFSMTEWCDRFGVSRTAGYATLERYAASGLDGLKDQSHAPRSCPHRITEEVREILLAARKAHPFWGPRKIIVWLQRRNGGLVLPAASTVGDLYSRENLVKPRKRRGNWPQPGRTHVVARQPNDLWTMDFKGDFRMGDGQRCYPLTIADAHTRYLLTCHGLSSTAHAGAQIVVERAFREYGLPTVIRTDNGPPFASKAIAGLSRLNVWWTELGIRQDRIAPGRPDQKGAHERVHLDVNAQNGVTPAL